MSLNLKKMPPFSNNATREILHIFEIYFSSILTADFCKICDSVWFPYSFFQFMHRVLIGIIFSGIQKICEYC